MANKRGGPQNTLFKKGASGNKSGRKALPEELRLYRDFDGACLKRIFGKYAMATMAQLEQSIEDPAIPAMELLVAKTIKRGVADSDGGRLAYLLDRIIPKPKEAPPECPPDFQSMTTEQLLNMAGEVLGGLLPENEQRVITIGGTKAR